MNIIIYISQSLGILAPDKLIISPLIYFESLDDKNRTALATSSG